MFRLRQRHQHVSGVFAEIQYGDRPISMGTQKKNISFKFFFANDDSYHTTKISRAHQ